MDTELTDYLKHNLNDIVRLARLAPSAHNTQPWEVHLEGNAVTISIARSRKLGAGDPTGRQTVIGLGIFTEAFIIAAGLHGLDVTVHYPDTFMQAVLLKIKKGSQAPERKEQVDLLQRRSSDRSLYSPFALESTVQNHIASAWPESNAEIVVSTDAPLIQKTAQLTAQGMQLALSTPAFRNELSEFLLVPGSHKKIGIPVRSMRVPAYLLYLQPFLIKHNMGLSVEVKQERKRWLSASGLVYILTGGDMPRDWFNAGRAYLHTSLAIEREGLSQATSAAVVEASDFHEDIEKLLGTKKRIQCLMRIGKGSNNKIYSPRLDEEDLIT